MEVIPGIAATNPNELARKISLVLPYVKWMQLDIADNSLVSSATFRDFSALKHILVPLQGLGKQFEAHILVADSISFVRLVAEAGFSRVTAAVETNDPREFLAEARSYELEVGLSLGVDSEIESLEPFLEELDYVVVMMGELDSSNHIFQPEAVEKIKVIHRNLPDLPIVAEVGITPDTAKVIKDAGASRMVVGSYIYSNEQEIMARIQQLQE